MIKKLLKRFREYIYDPDIDLKDRSFVLFSTMVLFAMFVAVPCGMIMKEPVSATISTLLGTLFFAAYVFYMIQKNRIERARYVISFILVFLFFPAMFFTNGGARGGAAVWLLLGAVYMVMVLDGKFRFIMTILNVLVMIICWTIGYFFPETITEYSRGGDFFDTLAALIIVSNVVYVMVNYQRELYHSENELAERKVREVEELNRAQNHFFSSMSHEIRTPINTVLGLNEIILRQKDASEEIRKDARNIQGAGKMLLALINDILDMSKIEAGKMDIVPVNYNVSSLISEIVNMIWLKADEKGLRFIVDIDPGIPESLFGDEVRIKQILINLLNNAVKYTKEGSVSLHMECDITENGDAFLKINVSDTGMGIKPESLPHLFDSFRRIDEEKNRHIEGTGLGLSIVKQLVGLMDGEITVNSVYTEGTSFEVTLKQGVSSDKNIGDINITGDGGVSGNDKFEHSFYAPDVRILIVDDNEMNLQVEEKLLNGTGITTDMAFSGREALSLTLHNRYDLIFMDHLMPEMDGIECYERIRRQNGGLNGKTPTIVLTANAGGENIELYNNSGFDGYLVKPVSGRQLEDMLIAHLPAEKLIINENSHMSGVSMSTAYGYERKKPVAIATSSTSDLPSRIFKELEIDTIPYTVITDEGVFYDNVDIDSEELIRYMGEEHRLVLSEPPTEEVLIRFFSEELKKAHHLIYITLSVNNSREYGRAVNAAKSFENVIVINSELVSSATGILVMVASKLAKQGLPVEKIVSELEETKKLIRGSFVIRSTDIIAKRERISPLINSILKTLWLRPVLKMDNDNLGVGRLLFGSEKDCYEKYIKHAFPSNEDPDTSFVFITYVGMEEEELIWIEEKLSDIIKFDNVVFQKASAGISSNCGEGTFGIIYMLKSDHNYNFGSYFEEEAEEEVPETAEEEVPETAEEELPAKAEDNNSEERKAKIDGLDREWYEIIPGIDPEAAVKNSGSKDAFLSVLKIYHDTYEAKSGELNSFYESGDWENYTIRVHALKSSSRLVGALKTGDDAEALEMAGKKGDIGFIREHHEGLMREYREIVGELSHVFGAKDDRAAIPQEVLEDAYGGLLEFAESMDYELSRMVLDSVKEYKLSSEDEKHFKRIETSLSQLDWDGIKETIKEITQ
ncbi:MAG: DegV family EDD domain-containing protein [Lachnospiraceae bacterium]|nr:DegV family EDD domain-containing protein [Lachnospiraceae bacterium]